jgi:hypothetical protein
MPANKVELATILDGIDPFSQREYGPSFSDAQLAELATLPDIEERLLAIIRNTAEPSLRRLAAVEALDQGGWTAWKASPSASQEIAEVLAWGLVHDSSHNRWGLPGNFIGYLGKLLVDTPNGVRKVLEPLVDNTQPLTIYGSEAATVQASERFTLGDLARYLLAEHERKSAI